MNTFGPIDLLVHMHVYQEALLGISRNLKRKITAKPVFSSWLDMTDEVSGGIAYALHVSTDISLIIGW